MNPVASMNLLSRQTPGRLVAAEMIGALLRTGGAQQAGLLYPVSVKFCITDLVPLVGVIDR
jgi:hypothetical protein